MSQTRESVDKQDLYLKYAFEQGVSLRARTIQLVGEVDSSMFKLVDSALTELEMYNQKAVTFRINSEGGSVYDALAIIGRMESSKCRIITEGYGAVMSAATAILAAGSKRRLSRHTVFMHHEASYDTEGRHSEIKALVKQRENEERGWARLMAEYTDRPVAFWLKNGIYKDTYFTAQQLLDFGVVDSLL